MEIERSYLRCETQRVALKLLKLIVTKPGISDREIDRWLEDNVFCEGASWNDSAPHIFITIEALQKRYDSICDLPQISIKKVHGVYDMLTPFNFFI